MGGPIPRRTGFLARDGERIYYEVNGAGPALVLCHGAGGNHAVWFQQVAWFAARGRCVVAWDQRGFGRSTDHAKEGGPLAAAADLGALLEHLELPSADLVGQSMGGWAALALALAQPERARRLVLSDTVGGIGTPQSAERVQDRVSTVQLEEPAALGRHPALDPSLAERDPALAHLYQMLGGFGEPDLARVAPRLFALCQPEEAMAAFRVPTLFVVGSRDRLFPPAVIRRAAARLPDARVVEIEGAGHSPYFERAAEWNARVAEFLDAA